MVSVAGAWDEYRLPFLTQGANFSGISGSENRLAGQVLRDEPSNSGPRNKKGGGIRRCRPLSLVRLSISEIQVQLQPVVVLLGAHVLVDGVDEVAEGHIHPVTERIGATQHDTLIVRATTAEV